MNIDLKQFDCPSDLCWCEKCVQKSSIIRKAINDECHSRQELYKYEVRIRTEAAEKEAHRNKIKPIATEIRKKHKHVFRFNNVSLDYGDGYSSATTAIRKYGIFSTIEIIETVKKDKKIKDDIVVVNSNQLSDDDIIKIDDQSLMTNL